MTGVGRTQRKKLLKTCGFELKMALSIEGLHMNRIPLRMLLERITSCALLAVMFSVFGCDVDQAPKSQAQPISTPVVNAKPRSRAADAFVFDPSLRKSIAQPVTGDMRPIFVFSGRIQNRSSQDISDVTVRLGIFWKDKTVDETDIHIHRLIPPGGISSFSQEVHILPPSGKWDWAYTVVDAQYC